jgi:hypothetical protein
MRGHTPTPGEARPTRIDRVCGQAMR